ncbi:MAG: phosphoribosylaminoimidazolesuccinocarboxamide synthase [Oscillospiraceae bacterium]|nr:phosphoribosylaminoimidazolesuccinocarboxamide synthase [Oscillospiraceae bacterium]
MEKRAQLYEGKAKKVYATDEPEVVIVSYKDDATAFDGKKKGTIQGKGSINNRMTNHLMKMLSEHGIPTHLVEELSDRETAVRKVAIVPLEVIVRNISAGHFASRYGVPEGIVFDAPVVEFSYKNDELHDPLLNDDHAVALKLASREEIARIREMALKINELLKATLSDVGVTLVDFKLEFGKASDGTLVLADEISPDTCRFWDSRTGEKLDKDRFRRDLGGVEDAYIEMRRRILGE